MDMTRYTYGKELYAWHQILVHDEQCQCTKAKSTRKVTRS